MFGGLMRRQIKQQQYLAPNSSVGFLDAELSRHISDSGPQIGLFVAIGIVSVECEVNECDWQTG